MENWGIRARLALAQVLLLCASLAVLTWISWIFEGRLVREGLEARAMTLTDAASRTVALPLAIADQEALARQVRALAADPDVVVLQVLDAGGRSVASAGALPQGAEAALLAQWQAALGPGQAVSRWRTAPTGGLLYECLHPVVFSATGTGPERVGSLRLALSSEQAGTTLRRLRRASAGAAFLLLVLALSGAFVMSRRLVAPLERLTTAAEEVARGNLDARVPSHGPGEIGRLAAAFGDMTRALAHNARALREVNERELSRARTDWDATFDAIADLIVVHDAAGHAVRTNRAFRRAAQSDGLLGAWLRGRLETSPPAEPGTETGPAQVVVAGTHLSISAFRIRGPGGEPAGSVTVMRDVSERERTRDRLAQAEKLSALGLLVSGVAHEINNPLSGIVGFAELALRQAPPEGLRDRLEKIRGLGERVARLVRNLLTVVRPHPPQRRAVDLNALVRETLDLRAYDHAVNNVSVETALDPALPAFAADPHQIQQVLLNLLVNAEQAMKGSGRGRRLRVTTALLPEGHAVLAVEDTGPGIEPSALPRLFDPFFTTKPAGHGTGLGLSLAHALVRDHGGTISAANRAEGGAEFRVRLPLAELPEDAPDDGPPPPPRGDGRHVLLIDDEPAVLEVAEEVLTGAGYAVSAFRTVDGAWEALSARPPDLVLSDLRMPGKDGRDVEILMRTDPGLAAVKLGFMTGDLANPETLGFARSRGVAVLAKPFSAGELLSFVGCELQLGQRDDQPPHL